MTLTLAELPCRDLMQQWRRQIGHRHSLAAKRGPRPFAVVSYMARGPLLEGRYTIRDLMFVALFDERTDKCGLATRLVGTAGAAECDGLRFGGGELSRFDKDLRLVPVKGRRGARLDASDGDFFSFALSLERYLERCARHPFMPRRRAPRLPILSTGGRDDDPCVIDLSTFPKRQVIAIDSPATELVGRSGTTTFDFYRTRFRAAR